MDTVKRAAALLDRARPGWHNEIDTQRFTLNSLTDCIIGQLYGEYHRGGWDRFRLTAGPEAFELYQAFSGSQDAEWLEEIAERRWVQQELIEEKDVDMEKVPA